jgi:hypothetical protein
MGKRGLSQSTRKYVRLEKARIRRESSDVQEQKDNIEKLYQRIGTSRLVQEKTLVQSPAPAKEKLVSAQAK